MRQRGASPGPTPTTYAIEVFTDEQCTERPVNGQDYTELYVKLNRDFGVDDAITYGTGDNTCQVITDTTEDPTIGYRIYLYVDFISAGYQFPLEAGDVLRVLNDNPSGFTYNGQDIHFGEL